MTHNEISGDQCRYHTLPQAAKALGIPVSTLRRAVNAGLIKCYTPFSSRKRVLLSEVVAAIATHNMGGRTLAEQVN